VKRVLVTTVLALSVAPLVALAQAAGSRPDCVQAEGFVRWGASAYNHWVRVENHCARSARCRVSTDVDPQVQTVDVSAGETKEVLTYRGSPARTFTATVSCELAD